MLDAFRGSLNNIEAIDKLSDPYGVVFKAKRVVKNVVFRKNYLRDREPRTLKAYARQVETQLAKSNAEIVFSPGTKPIAYLKTDTPIVFWTDATFDGMIDFYPEFTNLCEETIFNGRAMEQAALSNCRLAIYSSEWAAKTARDNYNVDGAKIKVVPFGANLTKIPSLRDVEQAIEARGAAPCKLLFVGVDWYRKGGEKALAVATMLNQRGLEAELYVVGCRPPRPVPPYVKTYGYLSKNNRRQNEILSALYKESEFFILPSEAECAAVVIAEASAYGLPAVTTNVGGMRTVVMDEKNGRAFDPPVFVEECTDYILRTLSEKERYRDLCISSFREHAQRLNWHSAVGAVLDLMALEGLPVRRDL